MALMVAASSTEIVVCASCPDIHHDAMNKIYKDLGITKAYARKGDMQDMLSGASWIPKWESK
jgi:hypothetical protein